MSADETQPVHPEDELNQAAPSEVVGVLDLQLTSVALGPDYPAVAISAEIGRVAIAAARVDEQYALLLSALHAGRRTTGTSRTCVAAPVGGCVTRRSTGWRSCSRKNCWRTPARPCGLPTRHSIIGT